MKILWTIYLFSLSLNILIRSQNFRGENLCPYLNIPGRDKPVLYWICGSETFIKNNVPGAKITYDCCPGYERSELLGNKCGLASRSWQPIIEYLREQDHPQTAHALSKNDKLADLGNNPSDNVYTVFVPQKDDDITTKDVDYVQNTDGVEMLVAPGRHYSQKFKNGEKIPTNKGTDIKVTTYSNGLVFLECKLLTSPDHETANGLVQYVDGPIPPTYQYPTVLKRLVSEPELTAFAQDLPTDLRIKLDRPDSNNWFTVFAPTNDVWKKAVAQATTREAREALIKQHIMEKMICADAVIQKSDHIGPTLTNTYIGMVRSPDGKVSVVDKCQKHIPVSRKDLMAGTGVIHVIDNPIRTTEEMTLNEALECLANDPKMNVRQAADEMRRCNLQLESGSNTIVLLPNQDAFQAQNFKEHSKRFRTDPDYRCKVYAYNILQAKNPQTSDPSNQGYIQEEQFPTKYTAPNGSKPPVIGRYIKNPSGSNLMFNEAEVADKKATEFKNGVIYPVKTFNFPPEKDMLSLIKQEPNTTKISSKLASTGFGSELNRASPNVLFLAPIDLGWKNRNLENNYNDAQTEKLLQLHTIPHGLFGGDNGFIGRESIQEVDSLLPDSRGGNVKLLIKRNADGNIFIGHKQLPENLWSMVLKPNKIATDGVVWIVDWPMKCPDGLC